MPWPFYVPITSCVSQHMTTHPIVLANDPLPISLCASAVVAAWFLLLDFRSCQIRRCVLDNRRENAVDYAHYAD